MPFDLGRLRLTSGEGRRIDVPIELEELEFGGQRYVPDPARLDVTLDAARTTGGGHSLRLRFDTTLRGTCMRCLEEAGQEMAVDSREVDQPGAGEELRSPYVTEDDQLNVEDWARDALVLALPAQILCREECLGLCPECGANLNRDPGHEHEKPADSRFAVLKDLKLD